MSVLVWLSIVVLSWIVIFGGGVHVKWKRRENITLTLSLYSPRRRTKDIETTEQPSTEGASAV